jgi:hypothetical protein
VSDGLMTMDPFFPQIHDICSAFSVRLRSSPRSGTVSWYANHGALSRLVKVGELVGSHKESSEELEE